MMRSREAAGVFNAWLAAYQHPPNTQRARGPNADRLECEARCCSSPIADIVFEKKCRRARERRQRHQGHADPARLRGDRARPRDTFRYGRAYRARGRHGRGRRCCSRPGREQQSVSALLKSMIVASANDATVALAEFLFGSSRP